MIMFTFIISYPIVVYPFRIIMNYWAGLKNNPENNGMGTLAKTMILSFFIAFIGLYSSFYLIHYKSFDNFTNEIV